MKFLPKEMENRQLMPINFQYEHVPAEKPTQYSPTDDVLYVTYKDIATGKKYVEIKEKFQR